MVRVQPGEPARRARDLRKRRSRALLLGGCIGHGTFEHPVAAWLTPTKGGRPRPRLRTSRPTTPGATRNISEGWRRSAKPRIGRPPGRGPRVNVTRQAPRRLSARFVRYSAGTYQSVSGVAMPRVPRASRNLIAAREPGRLERGLAICVFGDTWRLATSSKVCRVAPTLFPMTGRDER